MGCCRMGGTSGAVKGNFLLEEKKIERRNKKPNREETRKHISYHSMCEFGAWVVQKYCPTITTFDGVQGLASNWTEY